MPSSVLSLKDDLAGLKAEFNKIPDMNGLELSSKVCTKEPFFFGDENLQLLKWHVLILE
jgi:carbamoyl-phosphate synthase small subunit